ncbi:GyrI-like domain-containing protein [Winogradskyella sp.]|jgi:effector-binding domain-containing protein|uniref:SRPBCC family protein n=1 Tax=Winogradskyella sp. TaxID=1883156 RepID=UPI0025DE87D8|nr:GyrI-like domain-containing protein [Winogradskyella sp.]MCT4628868.1 GyrI-like domain-containing protein [Winogradskyella sp.]
MKAFKYILLLVLILIIGFAIYIAVQPNSFEVTRTKTINAPQAVIYNNIIDFKNWEAWNSWIEEKPETKIMLSEQTKGVGGSYSWDDAGDIGTMKTIATTPSSSIIQEMQFGDFPKNDVTWNLKPNNDGTTEVTWSISGKDLPFGFKAFATIMGGMEKQIGPHYERGLIMLDSVIQEDMKRYDVKINGITEYGGGFYLYKTTNANSQNISMKMGQNFGAIMQFMGKNGLKQSGMPLTVYNNMSETNLIMSNGIPVKERIDIPEDSDVSIDFIPKMKVLKTTLTGNYTNLPKAWEATMKHLTENGLEQSDYKPFEIYTTDPGNYPNPADWKTEIYIPLK